MFDTIISKKVKQEVKMRTIMVMSMSWMLLCVTVGATEQSTAKNDVKNTKSTVRYATVLSVEDAGGYRYLKVDENGTIRWVAISRAPVKKGDRIGYDTRTVMRNFTSKALGKTFEQIIFANELYLPSSPTIPTLKSALRSNGAKLYDDNATEDFVEKPFYTVEEVHRWRKKLDGKKIAVKGKVYKVSKGIMKRDWVHVGDGTGSEQALTDDLVFTAQNVELERGAHVIAEGKITVERNFGFGYFYDVLVEEASFKSID
jgi:predicted heme/steroid binding protein